MNLARRSGIAALAALALCLSCQASRSDCLNATAVDNCVVGTWKYASGGPVEWMKQNMKMAQVNMTANETSLTFNPDGSFATSQGNSKADVSINGAPMMAMAQMSLQGSGQWSAGDGKINLCIAAVTGGGTVEIKLPNGQTAKMPMPQMQPTNTSISYTCEGDTLTTTQPMPRGTTMTTTYTRVQ
jgi:hypothetical protein